MKMTWFGDKAHPYLPLHVGFRTPVLTVGELIRELLKHPKDTPVGTSLSSVHGHVAAIKRVTVDEHGVVVLDQAEEMLYSEEVKVL